MPLDRRLKERTGFTDYGTFVKLPLGNSGMIHISKMGKWVKKPSEILTIGDLVQVEVLEIKEEKEKIRIGLRLKSVIKKS
jgi:predicted RNA-binding protein with RPS1 domain